MCSTEGVATEVCAQVIWWAMPIKFYGLSFSDVWSCWNLEGVEWDCCFLINVVLILYFLMMNWCLLS